MIELNVRFSYSAPEGAISDAGVGLIIQHIAGQRLNTGDWAKLNPDNKIIYLPALPIDWSWLWLVNKGDYVGTMPKRVGKYYYKHYGLKCPPAFLSEIGNIARQHSQENMVYTFEFVAQFDWQAGDFGDGGSCYWGDHYNAREYLQDGGGLAVRFYTPDGKGMARAWVMPVKDDIVIVFNGYGFNHGTITIARVLAGFWGMSYKKISLSNNGTTTGTIYINGGSGYVVGHVQDIDSISRFDLGVDVPFETNCYSCNTGLHEDDTYWAFDEPYCEQCFYESYDYCERCGETHHKDDLIYTDDCVMLCKYCIDRTHAQCEGCFDYFPHDELTVTKDDHVYCTNCHERLVG